MAESAPPHGRELADAVLVRTTITSAFNSPFGASDLRLLIYLAILLPQETPLLRFHSPRTTASTNCGLRNSKGEDQRQGLTPRKPGIPLEALAQDGNGGGEAEEEDTDETVDHNEMDLDQSNDAVVGSLGPAFYSRGCQLTSSDSTEVSRRQPSEHSDSPCKASPTPSRGIQGSGYAVSSR